jgi:hypothetical protein
MKTAADVLQKSEYESFFRPYLALAPFENIPELLIADLNNQLVFMDDIPSEKLHYRYAEDKWTIADVILHMIDAERVFSYRALRFARNDKTELPGFEQNDWVKNTNTKRYTISDLIGQFKTCRNQSIALFKGFDQQDLEKIGKASKCNFSVRSIGYMIIGHNRHHIEKIKTLYLR